MNKLLSLFVIALIFTSVYNKPERILSSQVPSSEIYRDPISAYYAIKTNFVSDKVTDEIVGIVEKVMGSGQDISTIFREFERSISNRRLLAAPERKLESANQAWANIQKNLGSSEFMDHFGHMGQFVQKNVDFFGGIFTQFKDQYLNKNYQRRLTTQSTKADFYGAYVVRDVESAFGLKTSFDHPEFTDHVGALIDIIRKEAENIKSPLSIVFSYLADLAHPMHIHWNPTDNASSLEKASKAWTEFNKKTLMSKNFLDNLGAIVNNFRQHGSSFKYIGTYISLQVSDKNRILAKKTTRRLAKKIRKLLNMDSPTIHWQNIQDIFVKDKMLDSFHFFAMEIEKIAPEVSTLVHAFIEHYFNDQPRNLIGIIGYGIQKIRNLFQGSQLNAAWENIEKIMGTPEVLKE